MIDIILPFFNRADLACRCLRAIEYAEPEQCRLIVVDDASDPDQAAAVRQTCDSLYLEQVFICRETNGGFGESVGSALEVALAPHFVLLNSDTIVTPSFAQRLVNVMAADTSIKAVAPVSNNPRDLFQYRADLSIESENSTEVVRSVALAAAHRAEQFQNQCALAPYLTAACLAIDRAAFEEVGGFNHAYDHGYFEDLDLCCKLRRAHYQLAIREDCFVYHEGQASYGALGDGALSAIIGQNLEKFRARWGHLPEHNELMTRIRQTGKPSSE